MRHHGFMLGLLVLLLPSPALAAEAPQSTPAGATAGAAADYLQAAIDDPARAADKGDDARRQMLAVMRFAGVKPGDTVIELSPGSGYWTRVLSGIVGADGHVYTIWPEEMAKYSAKSMAAWQKLAATPHYANVSVLAQPAARLVVPVRADLVFTVQNYHDYHNMGIDVAAFDRSVFEALKPGGTAVVIDHVAPAGSGTADTDTLHRIDPAAVKAEFEAAGFTFAGSDDALRNGDDPHDVSVFDQSIRGHTDQFMLRFRKPATAVGRQ